MGKSPKVSKTLKMRVGRILYFSRVFFFMYDVWDENVSHFHDNYPFPDIFTVSRPIPQLFEIFVIW